ncbi:MAG: glutaredoxin family protein [Ignavibacteriales bacterium]|nr:glutaredoxin family protein [Ignavibacteriales bacterium]
MITIEVLSKDDCPLCDEAKEKLHRINKEFGFQINQTTLSPGQPEYSRFRDSFPVVVAPNGKKVWGKVTEKQIRNLLLSLTPPPRLYYIAKFLEALAIVMVFFGFMYGLLGDMWMDLYLFLGGILVFVIGWGIEKKEQQKRRQPEPGR